MDRFRGPSNNRRPSITSRVAPLVRTGEQSAQSALLALNRFRGRAPAPEVPNHWQGHHFPKPYTLTGCRKAPGRRFQPLLLILGWPALAAACAWGIAEGPNAGWRTSGAPGVRAAPQSRGAKEFLGLLAPALFTGGSFGAADGSLVRGDKTE